MYFTPRLVLQISFKRVSGIKINNSVEGYSVGDNSDVNSDGKRSNNSGGV